MTTKRDAVEAYVARRARLAHVSLGPVATLALTRDGGYASLDDLVREAFSAGWDANAAGGDAAAYLTTGGTWTNNPSWDRYNPDKPPSKGTHPVDRVVVRRKASRSFYERDGD